MRFLCVRGSVCVRCLCEGFVCKGRCLCEVSVCDV